MPTPLGKHNPQLANVRELLTKKGRLTQARFALEGPTLLAEARAAGTHIRAVYVTRAAFERFAEVAHAEAAGIPVFVVDDASMARLSDVQTPQGVVSIAPVTLEPVSSLFAGGGPVAVLAGVQDPGNAGTLLRSAEAFGMGAVVFDPSAVEPHNPKVVRAAMGALFRLRVAVANAQEVRSAMGDRLCVGLDAGGEPIASVPWRDGCTIVVGSERQGLGEWARMCTHLAAIPMAGLAESLNAGIAGSIAFYEATKRRPSSP